MNEEPGGAPVPAGSGEAEALRALEALLPPAPPGEVWIGDDAAVLAGEAGPLLLATDLVAEGVHFDRRLSDLSDVGWKVLAVNLSDVAAMGGRPLRAVAAVAGAFGAELAALYGGLLEAAERYACPIVGGDLSDAADAGGGRSASAGGLVCAVSVLGTSDGRAPVLRSGGRAGDEVYVTGPLGAAAAGLRMLRADPLAGGPCAEAHRRPLPRLAEGQLAAGGGARAMIDVSDGLGIDLDRLAGASGLGVVLDELPLAAGASEQEALGGGEDYELLIAADPAAHLPAAFAAAGLRPLLRIGRLVADQAARRFRDRPLPVAGWLHGRQRTGDGQAGVSTR